MSELKAKALDAAISALLARYAAPAGTSAQDAMQKGFDYGKAYAAQDAAAIRNAALEDAALAADYTGPEGRFDFQRAFQQGRQDAAKKVRALKTDQQEKGNA